MDLQIDERKLRRAGIRLLVAFGSRAEGNERAGSDLDLGFACEPGSHRDLFEDMRVVAEAVAGAEGDLDLVDLGRADPLLLFEVASRGRVLFQAEEGDFEEFRIRAVKRYYDTAWLRRLERDALRERYG